MVPSRPGPKSPATRRSALVPLLQPGTCPVVLVHVVGTNPPKRTPEFQLYVLGSRGRCQYSRSPTPSTRFLSISQRVLRVRACIGHRHPVDITRWARRFVHQRQRNKGPSPPDVVVLRHQWGSMDSYSYSYYSLFPSDLPTPAAGARQMDTMERRLALGPEPWVGRCLFFLLSFLALSFQHLPPPGITSSTIHDAQIHLSPPSSGKATRAEVAGQLVRLDGPVRRQPSGPRQSLDKLLVPSRTPKLGVGG
ncbi:hypothetical protein G7046_g8760 [Stylonectria norvegica]|nr:hypothetical protein G7046_g8760 [Stylonectria norvegica]